MDFSKVIENSIASIEKDDLRVLLPLIDQIKPTRILEIGAWRGNSARMWIEAFNPVGFITIEKDSYEDLGATRIPDEIGHQMWYDTDSHDSKVLDDLKIYMPEVDFLFIDGDHSFDGAMKDYDMYSPLVRKGGIVVLHDVVYHVDKTEEVDGVWALLKADAPYVEIRIGKNSTGIGVLYK